MTTMMRRAGPGCRTDAALQRWAADDLRSMNGQVEFLLRRTRQEAGHGPDPKEGKGRGREMPAG